MARNEMTFAVGNTTAAKLTPELHDLFVNTVRITGRISVAAGRCAIAVSTARAWMAKGRLEEEGAYHDFVNAVEKAKAEFLLLASKRLNQLALGGRVEMPAWDKNGNPVRDHREDCAAIPGIPCGCPLVLVEKVLLPESRVLMWQIDRCDPQPSAPEDGAQFEQAERSDEERVTRGLANYALVKEALKILSELGADISTIPEGTMGCRARSQRAPAGRRDDRERGETHPRRGWVTARARACERRGRRGRYRARAADRAADRARARATEVRRRLLTVRELFITLADNG